MRRLPNILVTGTPGVGKTSLCQNLQFMMSTKADPGSTAMLFDGLSGVLEDLSEQRGVEWSWGEYEDDEREFPYSWYYDVSLGWVCQGKKYVWRSWTTSDLPTRFESKKLECYRPLP